MRESEGEKELEINKRQGWGEKKNAPEKEREEGGEEGEVDDMVFRLSPGICSFV